MTSPDSPPPNPESEATAPQPAAPPEPIPAAEPTAPVAQAAPPTPAEPAAPPAPPEQGAVAAESQASAEQAAPQEQAAQEQAAPGAEGKPESAGEAAQAAGGATPGAEGAPKKKRRRRRKKKGPHAEGQGAEGAEAAEGAEGEEAAAAATPEGEGEKREERRSKKEKRRREEGPRERPAFGMGDVVFGKIIEITEECLFVDLSGKGKAIFDRRELDLPEEPAQGPGSEIDDDDDFPPPPPRAEGEEGAEASAEPTEEEPATEPFPRRAARIVQLPTPAADTAPAEAAPETAAPADTPAPTADAEAETATAEAGAAPAPGSAPHADTDTEESDEPSETKAESISLAATPAEAPVVVTLPPVVLEMGANFVGVVHNDGGRGGLVVLTRHPRRARLAKPGAAKALREKTTVLGLVTGVIKGGIEVDIDGLRAFAPGSHVDMRHGADLHYLIGKRLPFFVTQYAKRGKDIVLSRKSLIEAEAKTHREEALRKLVVGNVVEGTVRSVVPFGAFIDVGGIEGLVPLTEMSHNRGDTPHDVFSAGQPVQVLIQRIDVKGKVWLSHKACLTDPWSEVAKKYAEGTRHKGTVARIQPFGVFVELETGIDGLIHTADLSVKRIEHPSEVVKVGDEIDVLVAHVDAGAHRIGLHPVPADWSPDQPFTRVSLHKIVRVQVTAIDPSGLHVKVLGATGRSARGYITGAGTGTPRGTELRKSFPVGSEHDAKVIDIDPRRGEVKLSIKAVKEDTERNAYKAYRQQVKAEAKFGTFGDLLKKSQEPKS